MKKEFARFFGDRRLVLTALVLPGAMMYLMYTFMGQGLKTMMSSDKPPVIYAIQPPPSIQRAAEDVWLTLLNAEAAERESVLQSLSDKSADVLLVFPAAFDAVVARYEVDSALPAPNIEVFYNSVVPASASAYAGVIGLLDRYETSIANKFDINRDSAGDIATKEESTARSLGMFLPMLILMFMYSGAMSTTTESIAGEKERGTLATVLITPITSGELAAGKILSMGAEAFLCGVSSIIGIMLSMPALLNATGEGAAISVNIYGPLEYAALLLVILPTVFLIVTLIALISAYARTIRESQMTAMPLMLLIIATGVSSMFGDGPKGEFYYYLIPIYNSAQCMSGVFAFDYSALNLAVTVVVNTLCALAGGYALSKMFRNEKILFSR
jgi:sodium transport system permease protein